MEKWPVRKLLPALSILQHGIEPAAEWEFQAAECPHSVIALIFDGYC